METLIKTDIFFFVTTISVIILTIFLIICFYYFARILKNFKDISVLLKKGVNNASKNIDDIGKQVSDSSLFRFIFGKKKINKRPKIEKK